jgi:putative transcriptional regulator
VDKTQIRFFVGYSGWDAEQLEEELSTDSWYISEIGSLPLFETEEDDLWGIALKNMGGEFSKLANFPIDPTLN